MREYRGEQDKILQGQRKGHWKTLKQEAMLRNQELLSHVQQLEAKIAELDHNEHKHAALLSALKERYGIYVQTMYPSWRAARLASKK